MNTNGLIDLTGLRFGKLTVIRRAELDTKSGNAKWVCKCDCGNISTVIGSKLRSGHTKSCGCNRISNVAKGCSKERLYRIWYKMKIRCYSETDEHYKWYGGRGIRVCDAWLNDFYTFKNWALKHGYSETLSIDRIDVNGNYCPENCRWVSQKIQCNNQTKNRRVTFENKEYTISQFAELLNYDYHTVINRLRLGWTPEKIANTPERRKNE